MSDIQERLNELDRALEQLRMPLDVMQRLHNAEQAINRIQARQDQADANTSESFKAIDRARASGDDVQHDLVTRTANAIYAEIKRLEKRISDCELAVGTDTLDPEQPVDTSWHPFFNFSTDLRPAGGKRVMTLVRGGNNITGPWRAGWLNWEECEDATIIAWRYAKEGE